jgi:hypothetical protein
MSFLINPFTFAVAGGDFESIATVTVGSGGAQTISFTSIPSTYQHLQIRGLLRTERTNSSSGDVAQLTFNSDTGNNYALHALSGDGSAASANADSSRANILLYRTSTDNNSASIFGAFVVDILDYASTTKTKTLRNFGGYDANGSGLIYVSSGLWNSTSAITSITIGPGGQSNDLDEYSTLALFGVKAP